MKMKAMELTPGHVYKRIAIQRKDSRIVGELEGLEVLGGVRRKMGNRIVRGPMQMSLTIDDMEFSVDFESEVEVLSA